MKEKPIVDCLLVTGMYGSGLSALTACLQLLGVNVGGVFHRGNHATKDQNAVNDAAQIHDLLFEGLGYKWDMIGNLPKGWLDSEAAAYAKRRIRELIENRYEKEGLWAVVDARLCRLMPLWTSVLEEKKIQPGVLVMLRHPLEVAFSLKEGNNIETQQSLLLWLAMNKLALDNCSNRLYMITNYDQLVADPVRVLSHMKAQFQMAFPNRLRAAVYEILDVVRPDFKNHHLSQCDVSKRNEPSHAAYAQIYDRVVQQASSFRRMEKLSGFDSAVDPSHSPINIFDPLSRVDSDKENTDRRLLYDLFDFIGQFERTRKCPAINRNGNGPGDTHANEPLAARVFIPSSGEETPSVSESILLNNGEWQQIRFPVSNAGSLCDSGLRFSPLNTCGVASIVAMRLVNRSTGKICWQADLADVHQSVIIKRAIPLDTKNALTLAIPGSQAILTWTAIQNVPDVPLEFEAWVKIDPGEDEFSKAIFAHEKNLQGQLKETLQILRLQQNRATELEKALHQSQSIQKSLRKVVYDSSVQLYEGPNRKSAIVHKDFLNDEKVYFDRSVIAYDDRWQYPAITEKHAFEKAKELLPAADDIIYFGFPWATLIDIFHQKVEDRDRLFDKLNSFSPFLKNFKYVVTTCQHIYLVKYQPLFKGAGVTHIFWPHAKKGMETLPGEDRIKVYPFPLYPVNIVEKIAERNVEERRFLYSFVGAIDKPWYLTNTRSLIIDHLSGRERGKILTREAWHFDNVVYEHQIKRKVIDGDMVDSKATEEYVDILADSIFSLCPSGSGPNSIRLWESIGSGVVPVILSDTYQHPGMPSLWDEAVFWCNEDLKDISALPEFLSKMATDKDLMKRKLNALKQLWAIYGPDCFIYDILNLFKYH